MIKYMCTVSFTAQGTNYVIVEGRGRDEVGFDERQNSPHFSLGRPSNPAISAALALGMRISKISVTVV